LQFGLIKRYFSVMKIIGIIQARASSTRLPGKIFLPLQGVPAIQFLIRRVLNAKNLASLYIATTTNPGDDPLVEVTREEKIKLYRGSEEDVFSRYLAIAKQENADYIVRLTGDCPLHDPALIDEMIEFAIKNPQFDYVSNTIEPTYPDGLDIEVVKGSLLASLENEKLSALDREHVTSYIWRELVPAKKVNAFNFKNPDADLSSLRWTVDEKEDYQLLKMITDRFETNSFTWKDVLKLIEKAPDLLEVNSRFIRNEGYFSALKKADLDKKN